MLGNLLRVPRPHLPPVPPIQSCRSAPSKKLAGCRSSRHVNRTMHPNRLPRVQRASRSLDALVSLSGAPPLTHPPPCAENLDRIASSHTPFFALFFLSASHCLCFFSTLSVPQDFLTNSVHCHSLLSTAEPSFARTLVLYSETIGTGVPGDGLVDSQPCGSSCK